MEGSRYIVQARKVLENLKGKTLTVEQRREFAIELASSIQKEARRIISNRERRLQAQLARMMNDPAGKAFTVNMSDQCFRSSRPKRVADQMQFLLNRHGIPSYASYDKQFQLYLFKCMGHALPRLTVPLAKRSIRKATSSVILSGDWSQLAKHIKNRKEEGFSINLNHLGEAILGDEEAHKRLDKYLEDLSKPEVECISVKISTLCSQLNLVDHEGTLKKLAVALRQLYRTAQSHTFLNHKGTREAKFVNLDMEEFRDLYLTVDLFKLVLNEPEFFKCSAGIVLQAYIPDSFLLQQELTDWALQRTAAGGAPIKIRFVKGANLAAEKVDASIHGWPLATYQTKLETDANFKKMITYASELDRAKAVHIGVGSHNLFDIAYALVLSVEKNIQPFVQFEMLEGMAAPLPRVMKEISGDVLLYCPTTDKEHFQNAVAYLIRRLDENTSSENFLRYLFRLIPGTKNWQTQANLFSYACHSMQNVSIQSKRIQNRFLPPLEPALISPFQNEPDTDWSLPVNTKWAQAILQEWQDTPIEPVSLVIAGKNVFSSNLGTGKDPSRQDKVLFTYSLAEETHIDQAIEAALRAFPEWKSKAIRERSILLAKVAQALRMQRGKLIGAMVAETGKTVTEADVEVSEAIDFVEYYRRKAEELFQFQDIQWSPKGVLLVTPPWNFPCSIPMGGLAAALITGNAVLFKPAKEAILVGWTLSEIIWSAGISGEILQFVPCEDEPVGTQMLKDPRIATIVLTGSTETAKFMLKTRPGVDLIAETGGKNTMIITALADRDLAIKDLIHSAFSHAGQKCSACSLAILEAEVYDDPAFRAQLSDAVSSLPVGSAWNLDTRINPLIHPPGPILMQGLTTLQKGEEWLLEPKPYADNPNLWSPGIKLGVTRDSFTYSNELFGPVLGIMCAKNLEHALSLANDTSYGLTAGIHTLDLREQREWIDHIQAGNCYINRTITGAVVQRQPFGGYKQSSFGPSIKTGGPHTLTQFMHAEQTTLPENAHTLPSYAEPLIDWLSKNQFALDQIQKFRLSVSDYAHAWQTYFSREHDPSQVVGQDNILKYKPYSHMFFRIQKTDSYVDCLLVMMAANICGTPLEVSADLETISNLQQNRAITELPLITLVGETEEAFISKVFQQPNQRIRLLSTPSNPLVEALALSSYSLINSPVISKGYLELIKYLREVALSINYHRYGNLGEREFRF